MTESSLLHRHLGAITDACQEAPALDLACGGGRNGLYLLRQGIGVEFADVRQAALQDIEQKIQQEQIDPRLATYREVDLEQEGSEPLTNRQFGAVLVFRYLHRPLLPAIRGAVKPGGLVIYETFTVDQPQFGRPTNPNFLLRHGELLDTFANWDILEHWEGIDHERATAHIVARRPT